MRIDLGKVVGEGVASGGTAGQLLTKKTASDYDTEWQNAPAPYDDTALSTAITDEATARANADALKQNALTAGTNINLTADVISAVVPESHIYQHLITKEDYTALPGIDNLTFNLIVSPTTQETPFATLWDVAVYMLAQDIYQQSATGDWVVGAVTSNITAVYADGATIVFQNTTENLLTIQQADAELITLDFGTEEVVRPFTVTTTDLDDYYTKTQTEALIDEAGKVDTVNGIEPDSNKDVTVIVPMTSAQYAALEDPVGSGLYPSLAGKEAIITDLYKDNTVIVDSFPDYDNPMAEINLAAGVSWIADGDYYIAIYTGPSNNNQVVGITAGTSNVTVSLEYAYSLNSPDHRHGDLVKVASGTKITTMQSSVSIIRFPIKYKATVKPQTVNVIMDGDDTADWVNTGVKDINGDMKWKKTFAGTITTNATGAMTPIFTDTTIIHICNTTGRIVFDDAEYDYPLTAPNISFSFSHNTSTGICSFYQRDTNGPRVFTYEITLIATRNV